MTPTAHHCAALQHGVEHIAALPVAIPDALWTQHLGERVVAELSRPLSTSCLESAHAQIQQTPLGFQPRVVGSEQPPSIQTQGMQESKAVAEGFTLMVVVGPASGTTALCCCVLYCPQEWQQQPVLAPSEMGQDSSLASVKRQETCSSL